MSALKKNPLSPLMKRIVWIGPLGLGAIAALVWMFWPQITGIEPVGEPDEQPADALTLTQAGFDDLAGWRVDDMQGALRAFQRSCTPILKRADDRDFGPDPRMGTIGQWRGVCETALMLDADQITGDAARAFFEAGFTPWLAGNNGKAEGLFTGYYEPELRGSLTRHGNYQTPLYARPDDLVEVNLGDFSNDLAGKRIAGLVSGGRLQPYHDRTAIEGGALAGQDLELVWVDDPVDAFFLQIQGSGRVVLEDGSVLKVGYAATNGHPYFAIGRDLIERGALTRETVSLQTIQAWLSANPDQAADVMNKNASYVFFTGLPGDPDAGPLGSQGVPLETGRSLAVDRRFHAMGVPVWLETSDAMNADRQFHRLMIAQDTGGAIRGPVRGDIFFGPGDEAALYAGHMNRQGRKFILLPRGVDAAPATTETPTQ